jgi:uncharacterized protein involved in response to NO
MSDQATERPDYRGPALFSYGFRPFFLGASLFIGFAIPLWALVLAEVGGFHFHYPARDWHVHEMVFGFLPAVITGFLFTAIPNWTDRPPIRGRLLMLLTALWLLGRLLLATPLVPRLFAASVDAAFLIAVAGVVWREIIASKSWDRLPMGLLVSMLACANVLFHVAILNGKETGLPERMAIGIVMMLMALIGGRVTPSFTEEFLIDSGRAERPAPFSRYDAVAIALAGCSVLLWIFQPQSLVTGWLFLIAGVATCGRLMRWYGWLTWPEPLVMILHIGYGWFALSLLMLGGAMLEVGLPKEDAIHTFTTGAVGVMTLAVMTRASLGHTGRVRHAGLLTVLMYSLVNLGALLRVFGPSAGLPLNPVLAIAAGSWSGAYILFASIYGPYLLRPSLDE